MVFYVCVSESDNISEISSCVKDRVVAMTLTEVSLLTYVMELIVLSGNTDLLKRVLLVIHLNDVIFSLSEIPHPHFCTSPP